MESKTEVSHPAARERASKEVQNPYPTGKKRGRLGKKHWKVNSTDLKGDTVDGQNPAPPKMMIIPLFTGF